MATAAETRAAGGAASFSAISARAASAVGPAPFASSISSRLAWLRTPRGRPPRPPGLRPAPGRLPPRILISFDCFNQTETNGRRAWRRRTLADRLVARHMAGCLGCEHQGWGNSRNASYCRAWRLPVVRRLRVRVVHHVLVPDSLRDRGASLRRRRLRVQWGHDPRRTERRDQTT